VSAGCANDLGQPHSQVLAKFERKEFVQKINYREVPKDNAAW
jgi:hypothetical protein